MKWAQREPNQHDQNHVGDIENKENDNTHTQGGPKCAPFENKTEQVAQIVQALEALTSGELNELLQALEQGGAVEYLQGENVDRRCEPPLHDNVPDSKQNKGSKI